VAEIRSLSPAEIAAEQALIKLYACIREHKSFRFEAGAGAGKTFSLVKALRLIINERGPDLLKNGQHVACITYTNAATDVITARTDGHPAVQASTIHAFCWLLIKNFQPFLREAVAGLEGWSERLSEVGDAKRRIVEYDLGHPRALAGDTKLFLGHNDVLALAVLLMERPKFRVFVTARFPVIFIDEYQDTESDLARSLVEHFVGAEGPLVGLFGDSWQRIYAGTCGLVNHPQLAVIGKEANFRSAQPIVNMLNRMRPELPQKVNDPGAIGSVAVYHSNAWIGTRRKGAHWDGDLPAEVAHKFLDALRTRLISEGWDCSSEKTKILMLTHNVLAAEQNYGELSKIFKYNDSFIKKENPHIKFLVDTVEPVCAFYAGKRYGEMFKVLDRAAVIKSLDDKRTWAQEMEQLVSLRATGTIGQVIDHLKTLRRPWVPDAVDKTESRLLSALPEEIAESRTLQEASAMRAVPYRELVSLAEFVNDHTPFSTKHGVKGEEFENVLVVLGRGWGNYNWNRFLEMDPQNVPADKVEFYERNRNLFYVCCSRPKTRLALLVTQELSAKAQARLRSWFEEDAMFSFAA
jgi:DNA helicase-2/ATP-dependent DNA helicase PcrA